MRKIGFLLPVLACLAAGEAPARDAAGAALVADTVLTNGKVYTLDSGQAWAEAIAIKDGKISFVGSSEQAKRYQGGNTKIIDLDGKMVLPGLNDIHVHPVYGFTVQLFECVFAPGSSANEVARTVSACVEDNPDAEWIVGGQWTADFFETHDIQSPREWLDKLSGNKAVILRDSSYHNRWVNSKALALAGLDRNSPEIPGGEIVRDPATGEPNGLLYETAAGPVLSIVPGWTEQQYEMAAAEGVRTANRFGITGIKEAWARLTDLKAYKSLDNDADLTVHLAASMSVFAMLDADGNLDTDKLTQLREAYRGNHVNTDFVKLFMDGVPGVRTAAMLENYLPTEDGAESHNGMQHYPGKELAHLVTELDRLGLTVKVHTAGDRAVRVTLDAIEHTRKVNGGSGLRHEMAHAGYIHENDIPRFAALNAVPEISPYIWFPSAKVIDPILSAVGERGKRYWPVKSLLEAGAEVVAGSDWPAGALESMNPWVGMEALVSRRNPLDEHPGTLWQEQAITLEQALQIYTLNGAKALKLEQETGSIEVGKLADIIVLNQNLFDVPIEHISDTQVEMTMFGGNVVYQK